MPEVQEVFRMATQKVRPEPGALERQFREQRARSGRRRAGAVGLAAALAVVAAVVAVQISRDTGATRPGVGPDKGTPNAVIDLGYAAPSGIVQAGGSIWVSTYEGLVFRVDPTTNQIIDEIHTSLHLCGDIVAEGDSIYVSGCQQWPPTDAVRIDTATGAEVARWAGVTSPVFGGGKAWGFNGGEGSQIQEVDPASGEVTGLMGRQRYAMALGYAFDSLWLAGGPGIVRVDPETGAELASYPLPSHMGTYAIHGKIGGFASAGGYVWVTAYRGDVYGPNVTDGALYRIDPTSGEIQEMLAISIDPGMSVKVWNDPDTVGPEVYLDAAGGVVWVARSPDTVVGLDAQTGEIVATYEAPGGGATNVTVTSDAVWIANHEDGTVWRYDRPSAT